MRERLADLHVPPPVLPTRAASIIVKQPPKPSANLDFEAALASLEAIVAKIESSDLPLEEMIGCYEEGSKLLRQCEDRIANARQRVEKIARQDDDGVETTAFEDPAPGGPAATAAPTEELF